MIRSVFGRSLLAPAILLCPATAGHAETQSSVDLQAGLGYSTNPLLVRGDDTGSSFGRVSAYLFHGWSTERSSTSLSAYVENSTYFRRYSNKQAFDLAARTNRAVSEKLRLFGDLSFSGDVGGQLSSRFYGVPAGSVVPDPTAPGTFVPVDPDLFALSQRQYRISGQVGASVTLSPRDSLTTSVGAQRLFVSGNADDLNYTQYDGSFAYDRHVSERVTVGARLIAQYADYSGGRSVYSVGPQATASVELSSNWDLSAAAGVVRTDQDLGGLGGNHSSYDLALDGSLCRDAQFERICARVARRTQSSIVGRAPVSTSAGLDYFRRLSTNDTLQASASVVRSGNFRILGVDQDSTFYTLSASYDRKLNERLGVGVNLAARKLSSFDSDPRKDIGGSAYLRYRIGDVR